MRDKDHDDFFEDQEQDKQAEDALLQMIDEQNPPPVSIVESGDKVAGTVLSIGKENVFVDIGAKNEAMISKLELGNAEDELTVKVGDTVEAFVISTDNGEIVLSKSLSKQNGTIGDLTEAMKNNLPISGKVTGVNKGGFNVSIIGNKAFCPMSHMDTKYVENPNDYLAKTFDFAISRITEGGRNVVVSRIPILEQNIDSVLDDIVAGIESKKTYAGTITRITDFGLFVDIGSIEGLVHISEVSWERAEDLSQSFTQGQKVECVVVRVERGKTSRDTKIGLSMKQALEDPWNTVSEKFSVGQSVGGTVTRLAHFGAFVQLVPGIEGLVHISEMSWGGRVRHPRDVVSEGQNVRVTILKIDTDKKSVSLSLKDVSEDPWKDIESRFPVGSKAAGTVASKTKYGYFIDLADGVTGLLVFSNISDEKKESINPGDTLEVNIGSLDLEQRRMSLSYGMAAVREKEAETKAYLEKQGGRKVAGGSEFGDLLKAALAKKK